MKVVTSHLEGQGRCIFTTNHYGNLLLEKKIKKETLVELDWSKNGSEKNVTHQNLKKNT